MNLPILNRKGVLLEDLTWVEAEDLLTPETVIVIPLGAASKEHGPHLKLKNDWLIAEYLKNRILTHSNVVVAPTVNYSFYPAFVEYPGSVSLSLSTARDLIVEICESLAVFGPRRFYVLNTGISTVRALAPAAEILKSEGVLLRFTNLDQLEESVVKEIAEQVGGSHADEIETSMMLYIAPDTVDMTKAVDDYDKDGQGRLTRNKNSPGTYSPSGIFGNATLSTKEKGKRIIEAMEQGILQDIEELRNHQLSDELAANFHKLLDKNMPGVVQKS